MNIIVVGMGEVGAHIAEVLVRERHSVTLVDRDIARLQRAEESLDAATMVGHAGSLKLLRACGAETADLFIAVTDHSELNLVACAQAKALGAQKTIARVSGEAYLELSAMRGSNTLGSDLVINPTQHVAAEIRRLVRSEKAIAVKDFADRLIEMVQLPVEDGARVLGTPLKDVRLPPQTIVAAVLRDDKLVVPRGDDVIQGGDEVLVVGRTENTLEVERAFGARRSRFGRRALMVGGGELGVQVARALEEDAFHVTLLERDRARCDALARELDHAVVLHADGTNAAILEEEGVATADVFLAVSDADELNLMASVVAKDLGAPRCIALVHRPDYASVCERLGIDATLSPRLTVAKQVLRYVRAGNVVSVTPVLDGRAEFVELVASDSSIVANKALKDAELPVGAIVCAVLRPNGAVVPQGDDRIRPGDQVMLFLRAEARAEVERLFKSHA